MKNLSTHITESFHKVNESLQITSLIKEYTAWMTENGTKDKDEFFGIESSVLEFLENYHEDNIDMLDTLIKSINK